MGSWYWIGVSLGLGVGVGVLLAGVLGARRSLLLGAAVVAAGTGAALGFGIDEWQPVGWGTIVAGAVGGLLGLLGAAQIVRGALRRGGTRGGTAALVGGAGILVAAAAWIPVVGYLEAVALPALGARVRRARPERYAGLRTLARDE